MASLDFQIADAVKVLLDRRLVFSVQDAAEYASLEGQEDAIGAFLNRPTMDGSILRLDELGTVRPTRLYTMRRLVERWWSVQTLRWARTGLDSLSSSQLARKMSVSFLPPDVEPWESPPRSLVDVGRRWAMVDDGWVHGTFVFPWASVLRSSPKAMMWFPLLFPVDSSSSWEEALFPDISSGQTWSEAWDTTSFLWRDDSLSNSLIEITNLLPDSHADVLRCRLGITTGRPMTLEEVGVRRGVTRERVRQIQIKAVDRLRYPQYSRRLFAAFAAAFVQSGGSMIVPQSAMTSQLRLLSECIGLSAAHIPELEIYLIATDVDLTEYRRILVETDVRPESWDAQCDGPPVAALQFLSKWDGIRFKATENSWYSVQTYKTRARMLREALRSLGRAAHYDEIARECNRLFPDRQNSSHNWHAALNQQSSEALGIVWIGSKGMYGLREHGYSRPEASLFEAVAQIVEAAFSRNQRPVSVDYVMEELAKKRRELKRNSVIMALGFNDRLEAVRGQYVPKGTRSTESNQTPLPISYDMDAAFDAFRTGEPPPRG